MTEEERIFRNLRAAGCDSDTIQKFFYLKEEGRQKEQLRLLALHRADLLDKLHVSQSMIDCLDYLVYSMKN